MQKYLNLFFLSFLFFNFLGVRPGAAEPHALTKPARHAYVDTAPVRGVELSYSHLLENPKETSLPIKLKVTDPSILKEKNRLIASVSYFDAAHSKTVKRFSFPVKADENGNLYFEVTDLRPESIYGLTIDLYAGDINQVETAKFLENIPNHYMATSGKSDLAKARHQIATTALLENYAWELGQRHANSYGYCPGGWCGMFPLYCTKPYCKVFTENPSDSYRKFGKLFGGGSGLLNLKGTPSHGDHGWKGSHKFMVLALDEDTNQFLTVEGNFNNRVQLNRRRAEEITSYGQITPDLLWEKETPPITKKN